MIEKRCWSCDEVKPRSKFGRDAEGRGGLTTYCKPCSARKQREWRAAHPERVRELNIARNGYKRQWERDHRAACPRCGKPMGAGTTMPSRPAQHCEPCHYELKREEVDARGHRIEVLWAEGLTLIQIGAEFGWTKTHVGVEINKLRERGFNLPYRRKPSKPKHPELKR